MHTWSWWAIAEEPAVCRALSRGHTCVNDCEGFEAWAIGCWSLSSGVHRPFFAPFPAFALLFRKQSDNMPHKTAKTAAVSSTADKYPPPPASLLRFFFCQWVHSSVDGLLISQVSTGLYGDFRYWYWYTEVLVQSEVLVHTH